MHFEPQDFAFSNYMPEQKTEVTLIFCMYILCTCTNASI